MLRSFAAFCAFLFALFCLRSFFCALFVLICAHFLRTAALRSTAFVNSRVPVRGLECVKILTKCVRKVCWRVRKVRFLGHPVLLWHRRCVEGNREGGESRRSKRVGSQRRHCWQQLILAFEWGCRLQTLYPPHPIAMKVTQT